MGMAVKFVRAPNKLVLIAAGIVLLSLAVLGARTAVASAHLYRIPVWALSGNAITSAMFGAALLFVALRGSQFAGATAVIVATVITFGFVLHHVTSLVFGLSDHISWWTAVYPVIVASLVGPSLFPWSRTANKPALWLMGLIFATLTLLFGTVTLLARL